MQNPYLKLYLFFNNRFIVALRIGLFVLVSVVLVATGFTPVVAKYLFLVYFILLLHELFVLDKINHALPQKSTKQTTDPWQASEFELVRIIQFAQVDAVISKNLKRQQVRFFLDKVGASYKVEKTGASVDMVIKKAFEFAQKTGGSYIRFIDFFAAYLFVTEENTHFLRNLELNQEDLINILIWTHKTFGLDVVFKTLRFSGFGAFDSLVYGWNVEVKRYAVNLTNSVLSKPHPPSVIGRKREYEQMLVTLAKDSTHNALLVGEPGTGKTSLVEYFAYMSHLGSITDRLEKKVVYELFIDELLAGASTIGEQEARLSALLQDLEHSGNSILFVQNIENVFGGGGTKFNIASTIFEYLKSGAIQVIGTTTPSAFHTYLSKNESVASLFESIQLDEPDNATTLYMLFDKVPEIEKQFHVVFSYAAVKVAVYEHASYFTDRFLPGKTITLLEDTASSARIAHVKIIGKDEVVKQIETKTHIMLEKPTQNEKDTLLHLEEKIHTQIVDQDEAVAAIASAMRRVRSGFKKENRPISTFLFLGPTGVGKTETAKALAKIYFQDETRMIRFDMSEFQTQASLPRLLGSLPNGTYIPNTLTEQVKENPFSLVLLDEFEKAEPHILDLFLQVFDDGRLTDNSGKTISFANTIIIATSNAGSELVREHVHDTADSLRTQLIEYVLSRGIFKPELVNRFDEVVIFRTLSHAHIKQIIALELQKVANQLQKQEISLTYDDQVTERIIAESYSAEFGARNVRRYIEIHIEDIISRKILDNTLQKGSVVHLAVNHKEEIAIV